MMSINDTLTLHRSKRNLYLLCAQRAHRDFLRHRLAYYRMPAYHYVTREILMVPRTVDPLQACQYFIRHARAANRKLVQVKRLQRMLESPNNWNGYEA